MDVSSRKGRFSAILFIIVCYVTSGKGITETTDTSSTTYLTTVNETTDSSTVYDTTTHNGTNTTDGYMIGTDTTRTYRNGTDTTGTYRNGTDTTRTYRNGTDTTGTYRNGTDTTGSIPLWIPTIVISVICGLLFLLTITTIVCHRCHNRKIAISDVESVRRDYYEYVDDSKKDLHETNTIPNKSPNKECSKVKPSKKEEKTNIDIVSARGDYEEVLLDCTLGGTSLIKINQCQVLAKSKDVLNKNGDYSDIEAKEGSSKKESYEQRESPVYTQPMKKHVYSHVPSKMSLKNQAESFATSENHNVHGSHEHSIYYDHADLDAKESINAEHEVLDMDYDHLNLDREPNLGPKRDFTSQPFSIESILLEDHYDNGSNSFRENTNDVGAKELYSKVSARRKNDQKADARISGGKLEKDDSDRKVAEHEKVMVETDANVYYNIDKSKNSSKSTDEEHGVQQENKAVMTQSFRDFKITSQKQDTDIQNKSKEPSSVSGKAKFSNINVENMQNETGFTANVSVKNDGRTTKSGEILKNGSKFRMKETNYEEANPTEYQESTKPQKGIRSDNDKVETLLK